MKHIYVSIPEATEIKYVVLRQLRQKKSNVLKFLSDHGIRIDNEKVDALIESAVYRMKNGLL